MLKQQQEKNSLPHEAVDPALLKFFNSRVQSEYEWLIRRGYEPQMADELAMQTVLARYSPRNG
jgi:hypothetical protein